MQGRLVPMIEGRIQAFPAANWLEEMEIASRHGFDTMEWTIDFKGFHENPLLTQAGRARIGAFTAKTDFSIPSLTGDCLMQAPFWKSSDKGYVDLRLKEFADLLEACAAIGCRIVVVPLVDNGRVESLEEESRLMAELKNLERRLDALDMRLAFETDFAPRDYAGWMAKLPSSRFGINYDIGNSASLGYAADDEVPVLAERIVNVHVKDRLRGGTTVPLGQGAANIPRSLELLHAQGYRGNFILQTARSSPGRDVEVLLSYKSMVSVLLTEYWGSHGPSA